MTNRYTEDSNLLESLGATSEDLPEHILDPEAAAQILPKSAVTFEDASKLDSQEEEPETVEVGAAPEDISSCAKLDLDFLASLVMPLIFKYCFPPVFKAVWGWLLSYVHKSRSFSQLALGLPRGFGKTTLVKIFVVYCILFTKKEFILIISAKASLAENILSDVIDMLEEPNIKKVFGAWNLGVTKDTQALKKFGYRGRNITLAAIGAETSLRGLNIKNTRPDVMIFEDIQSRECADSEIQSTSLENWMVGTAMKSKSPHGCMFLFVANMYPTRHSILRKLKVNSRWTKFIAGGILADGTSLWEELQPIKQLLAEFENDLSMGKPEIFYAEVLNDETAASHNLIDLNKLPAVAWQDGDIAAGKFIIIDPANDKINSDAVSIGYFEVHNSLPMLMEVIEDRLSPGATIRKALSMALTNNCRLIVCEANAYQYSLLYWFEFISLQLGIVGVEAVPIYSGPTAKTQRILKMIKGYAAGELYIHEDTMSAVHSQITSFNPMKRDNIDGILDLLTYAPRVIEEFGEFVIACNIIEDQEFEGSEVQEFNSPF